MTRQNVGVTDTATLSPDIAALLKRDELPLPRRQRLAALADVGGDALREGGQPGVEAQLGQGAAQRLVVHPADHEHVARVVLLHHGRDESVLVPLEQPGDPGVEDGRVGHRVKGVGHPDILP